MTRAPRPRPAPLRGLAARLRRFAREPRGSFAVETVLMLPLLFWTVAAVYGFVDAYRMQALNLRATYTIGDLLSRQWNPVKPGYVDGLGRLHGYLTHGRYDTALRVTVVTWDALLEKHILLWSRGTEAAHPAITQATLSEVEARLPDMANGQSVILVETWMDFTPVFRIGLGAQTFRNEVVTAPRFVPQLLLSS